jgi:hypothetical protein
MTSKVMPMQRVRLVLGSLALLLVGSACEYVEPAQPRFGYEFADADCSNHIDDDYDGLIDCEDPDCIFTSGNCGLDVPNAATGQQPENTLELCTDNIDNDDNGQFDCGDGSCQDLPEACCFKETTNAACYDGLDNDGNGFADCGDFQCRSTLFVTVCRESFDNHSDTFPLCTDGIDNDDDGFTDCEDSACSEHPSCGCQEGIDDCFGNEDTFEACSDFLDNDNDGDIDCGDIQCEQNLNPQIASYCEQIEEDTLIECSDGLDNDGDGFADCADFSCNPASTVNPQDIQLAALCPSENTLEQCTDGIDNDENGFVDCADFGCDDDGEISEVCADLLETGPGKCSDGIDNDNNGFIDCGDFGCSGDDDPAVQINCQESILIVPAWPHPPVTPNDNCSDGLDNDNDGFADCDDWDCSWNPDVTVCQPPGERVCE